MEERIVSSHQIKAHFHSKAPDDAVERPTNQQIETVVTRALDEAFAVEGEERFTVSVELI